MIYLITGLPGEGKTAWAVEWVKAWAEREKRPVFFNAADPGNLDAGGLAILDPVALPWKPIDPRKWYEAPQGAIIVIDECQHVFEPRQRGGTQPEFARKLETHRHEGHDLVLITQHPTLIDAHDRKLVHKHFHLMRKFGTKWVTRHEFKGTRDYPDKSRKGSIEHQQRINKRVFKWYRSAVSHTGRVSVPWRVWLLVAIVVCVPVALWWWWGNVTSRYAPVVEVSKGSTSSGGTVPASSAGAAKPVMTAAEYVQHYVPRVAGLAYTAPAYDAVTAPVEAPYPAACVSMADRCQCYTQQGTRLDVPADLCSAIAAGGFFVPWRVAAGGASSSPDNPRVRAGSEVRVNSGEAASRTQPRESGLTWLGGDPRAHVLR
jgi:hypothetical protein